MANNSTPNKATARKTSPDSSNPLEKYLAFGFIVSVVVSVGAVMVILLGPLINNTWVPTGWGMIPILVMPFGFVCLIALLVLSAISRKRSNQAN